jgi:hypothetical protein
MATKEKLYPGYFSNLIKDEMLFVRTVETDSLNLYALGVFYNRSDAVTYLGYLKSIGLDKAYIINQYDLEGSSPDQPEAQTVKDPLLTHRVFTIQLKATRTPIDSRKVFPGYADVKEVVADDGFYKYIYGEYTSIAKAKEALENVKKDYNDAFIREINVQANK